MPARERIEELRSEVFAEDIEITDAMLDWTESELTAYFESGGTEQPASSGAVDHVSLKMCQMLAPDVQLPPDSPSDVGDLESARSSVDGWVPGGREGMSQAPTVPYAELQSPNFGDMELADELIDDDLEAGGDERTEDAILDAFDVPMTSVPVTRPSAAPPPAYCGGEADGSDDGVAGWSIRQLKEFLMARNLDVSTLSEKRELIAEVRRLNKEGTHAPASSPPLPGAPPPPPSQQSAPSPALARMIRKIEDIKKSGDEAFRIKDFEKADRHYSSALQRAGESTEPVSSPAELRELPCRAP